MIPPELVALVKSTPKGEQTFVAWGRVDATCRNQLKAEGVLIPTNRYAKNWKCPCGAGHLADVIWREKEGRQISSLFCSIAIPFDEFPIDAEKLRLYQVNAPVEKVDITEPTPNIVDGFTPYALSQIAAVMPMPPKPAPAPRSPREERVVNEEKLETRLKDLAFRMLGLKTQEEVIKAQKDITGHSLYLSTHIREATIGEMIDLKHTMVAKKGERPDKLQLLYLICKNITVYNLFSDLTKSAPHEWESKPTEELYRLVMNRVDELRAAYKKR